MNIEDSKKLTKNVFFVYSRIILTTVIGLLSTRLAFNALGQSDYGLYNVVAGIISVLSIISTAMTTTTRRFLNFEMGKSSGNINKIFNICRVINFIFAILLLFLAESLGMIYVYNYLNVASNMFRSALIVFHISTITATLSIINVPFQSLMAAKEKFFEIALIDVSNHLVKLIGVGGLFLFSNNRLIIYALLMSGITILGLIAYSSFCKHNWPQAVKYKLYKDKKIYKEIAKFNNYISLGASAYIGRSQGSNLMINYFFGTIVNGAFSIAYMIENYAMMAIGNFTTAASPQITQKYSSGKIKESLQLASKINRLSILAMTSIVFIALLELPFLLKLWLGTVPIGSLVLCKWTLISALVRSLSEGIPPIVQASGKIKWFQIIGTCTQVMVLIIGWFFFKYGFPPQTIIICYVITSILNFVVTILLLRTILSPEDISNFFTSSFLPIFLVIFAYLLYFIVHEFVFMNINPILDITLALSYGIIITYYYGLKKTERKAISTIMFNKISKK